MNFGAFRHFVGCVEDRADPEYRGRVRVRIIGLHTDDKLELPTEDLPWALILLPVTSSSTSGLGTSPTGLVEGSWVCGFFLDGDDCQQPVIFGTFVGKPTNGFVAPPPREPVSNSKQSELIDVNGNVITDSSGNPVAKSTPVTSTAGWTLGQTSAKYESNGNPGTINDYLGKASGDLGGASYGSYQFASFLPATMPSGKSRAQKGTTPLMAYLSQSRFVSQLTGTPATPEFDANWKKVASENKAAFQEDQHNYVKKKYYDVMLSNLLRNKLDLSSFGPGVQDLIFSTSVQFGPGKTSIFTEPLKNKAELNDKDIVNLVSDYKISNVATFFPSSPALHAGLTNRFKSEKADLLKLC